MVQTFCPSTYWTYMGVIRCLASKLLSVFSESLLAFAARNIHHEGSRPCSYPLFWLIVIFVSRPRRSIVSAVKKKGYPHPNPENQETTALSSSIHSPSLLTKHILDVQKSQHNCYPEKGEGTKISVALATEEVNADVNALRCMRTLWKKRRHKNKKA